jgi:cytidylate kinase
VADPVLIVGGLSGTGSTTASRLAAKRLGLEHVYGGGIFREHAKAAGETIERYNETLKDHPELERKIDDGLIERARQGRVVIESRVLAWILPDAIPACRVWLTCDEAERLRRVREREPGTDEDIRKRERLERERYETLYSVSLSDLGVHDLVVDTTSVPAEEVSDRILAAFRKRS